MSLKKSQKIQKCKFLLETCTNSRRRRHLQLGKVSKILNEMLIFCDFLNESCRNNFVAQGRNPCPREERKGKAKGEKKGETEVPSMETSGAGEAVISEIFRECHCRRFSFLKSFSFSFIFHLGETDFLFKFFFNLTFAIVNIDSKCSQ
jgi:hypothetical protein